MDILDYAIRHGSKEEMLDCGISSEIADLILLASRYRAYIAVSGPGGNTNKEAFLFAGKIQNLNIIVENTSYRGDRHIGKILLDLAIEWLRSVVDLSTHGRAVTFAFNGYRYLEISLIPERNSYLVTKAERIGKGLAILLFPVTITVIVMHDFIRYSVLPEMNKVCVKLAKKLLRK